MTLSDKKDKIYFKKYYFVVFYFSHKWVSTKCSLKIMLFRWHSISLDSIILNFIHYANKIVLFITLCILFLQ